jgi:regulator of protease activity HflC (stomatin/prohibitin superfamily)
MIVLILVVVLVSLSLRVVKEYDRGVIYRRSRRRRSTT